MNKRERQPEKPGFDAFVLATVVAEMRPLLVGAKVQKIQQPTPTELTLMLYGRAGAQKLLLSVDPRQYRLHVTRTRHENPVTPPGFCQVCRKYLDSATLDAITLPHFDRVVELRFRATDGEVLTLTVELMGRNANAFLVSGTGVVRGVFRPIPPDAERLLRPGTPYVPPPGYATQHDPLDATVALPQPPPGAESGAWLMQTFSGIGPFAAREIVNRAQGSVNVLKALTALRDDVRSERFTPHAIYDAASTMIGVWAFDPSATTPRTRAISSICAALDDLYADTGDAASIGQAQELSRSLDREIKWREKEIASAQVTLEEAQRADRYEEIGNNLLAALPQLDGAVRGNTSIIIPDLYDADATPITVALDDTLTLQENAERYFTRAHKARDAQAYVAERLTTLETERAALNMIAARLPPQPDADVLASLKADFVLIVGEERAGSGSASPKTKPAENPFDGHRIRTFTLDGFTLLVGESADANDYLTTKVASPSDLWLHVRGAPGAHGVLRTANQPGRVPETVLRKAAAVVAARSGSVKHSGIVAVDVTEKRYVRKPRGAKPGQVIIERERTLDVTPQLPG